MRRGFNCSCTSRTRSIISRPCSTVAPTTFTWSARLKLCLKLSGMPWWSNSGCSPFWPVTRSVPPVLDQFDFVGRKAGDGHGDPVLIFAFFLDVVGRPVRPDALVEQVE